jgi:hypothetical protein
VGTVVYAHVNPDFDRNGVTNDADLAYRGDLADSGGRWGGYLGTVGEYTNSECWDVTNPNGHHVHIELSNENEHGFSCFRPGMSGNENVQETEYIRYLGGAWASGRSQACPHGI